MHYLYVGEPVVSKVADQRTGLVILYPLLAEPAIDILVIVCKVSHTLTPLRQRQSLPGVTPPARVGAGEFKSAISPESGSKEGVRDFLFSEAQVRHGAVDVGVPHRPLALHEVMVQLLVHPRRKGFAHGVGAELAL